MIRSKNRKVTALIALIDCARDRALASSAGGEPERSSGASRPLERAADAAKSSPLDAILRSNGPLGEKTFESDEEEDAALQTRSASCALAGGAGNLEMSRMFPTPPSFDQSHLIPSPGDSATTAAAQSSSSTLLSPPGSVPPPAAATAAIMCSYGNPLTPASSQLSSETLSGSSPLLPSSFSLNALSPAVYGCYATGGAGAQLVPCDASRVPVAFDASGCANRYAASAYAYAASASSALGSHPRRDASVQATASLHETATAAVSEAALYDVRRADWTTIFLPAPRLQEGVFCTRTPLSSTVGADSTSRLHLRVVAYRYMCTIA